MQETKPIFIRDTYKGADKLKGKVAIITGEVGSCMQGFRGNRHCCVNAATNMTMLATL
jgi:hypothetical protein